MSFSRYRLVVAAATCMVLVGCGGSFGSPSGDQSAERAQNASLMQAGQTGGLFLGTGSFEPGGVTIGPDTGTAVGRRVRQLQGDLSQLQTSISSRNDRLQEIRTDSIAIAQEYYALIAAISARLQVGTTPGNPILVSQWGEAQLQLEEFANQIRRMNNLASGVAEDSSLAAYVLQSVRATYRLSGAVEEDHRQLGILEDEVNRTVVLIDRLLTELSDDINRQTNYLASERSNLQVLQHGITRGEFYGTSLSNRAFLSSLPAQDELRSDVAQVGPSTGARPLVVIRFDQPDVRYEQAVYQAASQALERRPQTRFDIVGVSPRDGSEIDVARLANAARGRSEEVLRSMVGMGMEPDRLTVSTATSGTVQTSEVHIYVR